MRPLIGLLIFCVGFLAGIVVGEYWVLREREQWFHEWKTENHLRSEVAELALRLVSKNKYQEEERRVEALRLIRNQEDKRVTPVR